MSDYPFTTQLRVRIGDINYGGHLANDKVLLYFQEARLLYLKELNASELDIGGQTSLTQTEAFISYKGEGFMSDLLEINVRICSFTKITFKFEYKILRMTDQKLIASGYTVMAGFDYQNRKLKKIPASFLDKVSAFQNGVISFE